MFKSLVLIVKVYSMERYRAIKANENCTIWYVLGDFNSVRFECERSGIRRELTY